MHQFSNTLEGTSDRLQPSRQSAVDGLRGIAALLVAVAHLGASGAWHPWNGVSGLGVFGVGIFFVISGYIVPETMTASGYALPSYFRQIGRRLARLHPPYLVTLGLIVGLRSFSAALPGYQGEQFYVEAERLLSHLPLLSQVLGYAWYSPVFWTLAFELQFYLLIGLILPLLTNKSATVRLVAFAALTGLAALRVNEAWLPMHLTPFLLGIMVFMARRGLMGRWAITLFAVVVLYGASSIYTVANLLVVAAAAILIIRQVSWQPLSMLGMVSYSLYLTHPLVFGYLRRLLGRMGGSIDTHLMSIMTISVAILVAFLFHRLVESPSVRLAKRIKVAVD